MKPQFERLTEPTRLGNYHYPGIHWMGVTAVIRKAFVEAGDHPSLLQLSGRSHVVIVMKRNYILSLPERTVRASAAVVGGLLAEGSTLLLPKSLRGTKLYQSSVDRLLRIVVELVGDVQGVFPTAVDDVKTLAVRKGAGNVVETAAFLAVGWSPLWLLAGASDLIGGTKLYLAALVEELKANRLLSAEAQITSFDDLLTSLEKGTGVLADAIDVPPLNLDELQTSWQALRQQAESVPGAVNDTGWLAELYVDLQTAAQQEGRSLLQVSSIVGLSALRVGGQLGQTHLVEHYRTTLKAIIAEGLLQHLQRISTPYLQRAAQHFDPNVGTWTEHWTAHLLPDGT